VRSRTRWVSDAVSPKRDIGSAYGLEDARAAAEMLELESIRSVSAWRAINQTSGKFQTMQ